MASNTLNISPLPGRVVSLVPSLTESLFDLGLGELLVGITDYCVYPEEGVMKIQRVGGTKNPDIEEILRLNPDLVLANQEENSRESVEALRAAGIQVWISFPKSTQDAIDVLYELVRLGSDSTAFTRVEMLERSVEWTRASYLDPPKFKYFCPIWEAKTEAGQPWWMTFNGQTYSSDLLSVFGGQNIFDQRVRYYPLEADLGQVEPDDPQDRDRRYPRVSLDEILAADPEVVVLPTEPYPYSEDSRLKVMESFRSSIGDWNKPIVLVDGSLITWHGTRLGEALQVLPELFQTFNRAET